RNRWVRQTRTADEVRGLWSQAVFQVDDSPRYESLGEWEHYGSYSAWTSGRTARPLPRRESSVRSDYQILEGTNRHTLTPTRWVQEEENLKLVLDEQGQPAAHVPYPSREVGVARYEHVVDFDFSAVDSYWQRTGQFWRDVRAAWEGVYAERDAFEYLEEVDGQEMFVPLFEHAERLDGGEPFDAAAAAEVIRATFARHLRRLYCRKPAWFRYHSRPGFALPPETTTLVPDANRGRLQLQRVLSAQPPRCHLGHSVPASVGAARFLRDCLSDVRARDHRRAAGGDRPTPFAAASLRLGHHCLRVLPRRVRDVRAIRRAERRRRARPHDSKSAADGGHADRAEEPPRAQLSDVARADQRLSAQRAGRRPARLRRGRARERAQPPRHHRGRRHRSDRERRAADRRDGRVLQPPGP